MAKVRDNRIVPANSIMKKSFGKPDYQDAFYVKLETASNLSIDDIFYTVSTYNPRWMKFLMKVRDFLVRFAGLKTSHQINCELPEKVRYEPGSRSGLFRILDRNENEIVFFENDKHLNFQSSLYLRKDPDKTTLYSITHVHFNNFTGKFYFFFVRPFHRFIIKMMLKQLAKTSLKV